jgi:hypothetical protein
MEALARMKRALWKPPFGFGTESEVLLPRIQRQGRVSSWRFARAGGDEARCMPLSLMRIYAVLRSCRDGG